MTIDPPFTVRGGDITLDNAEQVKADGLARLAELTGDTIEVDLQDVPRANTVTIAVLTAWHRAAKLQNKSMVFMNLSPELRNIIDFSGLQNILSLCSKS